MPNPYDKPATMRTRENRHAKLANPLGKRPPAADCEQDAFAELAKVLEVLKSCDNGAFGGPFAINSRHYFAILFETYDQREAFRKALSLTHHEEQYWDGAALLGSLDYLTSGRKTPSFAARENPFAQKVEKRLTENAVKYSQLRAETKKVTEKMKLYIDDRTWIAVCFPDGASAMEARKKLRLPTDGKYIHIEDMLASIQDIYGIALDVPVVPFALRAEARPDKALNALAES